MTAEEYWKEQELKKGVSKEVVNGATKDMKPTFDLMEKYASTKDKKMTVNKKILIT
jgi:hypothetical protein